jgi:hypothetical protein
VVRLDVPWDHSQPLKDAASPTVSQKPFNSIQALAETYMPKRRWISQVSEQRKIRDAPSGHTWIGMPPGVRIVEHS